MGIVITFHSESLTADLGGLSTDRALARIHFSAIRSLTKRTDGVTVEIVFGNGEIQGFPYTYIDSLDGDTNISTQDILYDKMEDKIFID